MQGPQIGISMWHSELEALSLGVHSKLALWRTLLEPDLAELASAPVACRSIIRAKRRLGA